MLAGLILITPGAISQTTNTVPEASTEVDEQLHLLQSITTVSASVRKTTQAGGQTVRLFSRIHFKSGGLIHVENVTPAQRRVIADGTNLYYYDPNSPRGFSSPISKLDKEWSVSLNSIPASAMEHLLKMKDLTEKPLPSEDDKQTLFAYHRNKHNVVMTLDQERRITRLQFFEDEGLKKEFAVFEYSNFVKEGNAWLALTHKATRRLPDGTSVSETRQFDNLVINKEIPDKLFDHKLYMDKVEFTSEFEKTWK